MRQLLDSLQMLASDQPVEDKAAARTSVRMPCPRRGKLPHTAETGRLRRRIDRTSRRAFTRDRCAAAGRGAGRCFPGIKPHRPAPRSVPRCSNGEPAGQTHPNPPSGAVPRLPPARTDVRKLRHAVLGIGPRSLPQWPPAGARSVLGGVRGPRVPGSGDRELRASHVLLPHVRADGANSALLGRATADGPVVHSAQVCLRRLAVA